MYYVYVEDITDLLNSDHIFRTRSYSELELITNIEIAYPKRNELLDMNILYSKTNDYNFFNNMILDDKLKEDIKIIDNLVKNKYVVFNNPAPALCKLIENYTSKLIGIQNVTIHNNIIIFETTILNL